jgi:hypothetical protein
MFLTHLLNAVLGKRSTPRMSESRPSTRLRLEELEDRLTPSPIFAGTDTNASIQVTPNLGAGTVTEKVTISVTTAPTFNPLTGQITPVPAGAGTPTGTVLVNLNNQQQQLTLDSKAQATATFTVPLLSILSSQELTAEYTGAFGSSSSNFGGSEFNAPIYMNYDNLFLPATITFDQLSPQQQSFSFNSSGQVTSLPLVHTANGETESFGMFSYHYVDPGTIDSVDVGGMHLPGIFATALGAYGPRPNSNG